jgi:molecular chaperone IbpA
MSLQEDMIMRSVDFSPLARTLVGYDRISNLLDAASETPADNGYPPYNIERTGENAFRVTLAVAGFARSELDVVQEQNKLTVTGRKADGAEGEQKFLFRGIASRAFKRVFQLADHVKVAGANLENGLLTVELAREVPEAQKPRTIAIETAGPSAMAAKAA